MEERIIALTTIAFSPWLLTNELLRIHRPSRYSSFGIKKNSPDYARDFFAFLSCPTSHGIIPLSTTTARLVVVYGEVSKIRTCSDYSSSEEAFTTRAFGSTHNLASREIHNDHTCGCHPFRSLRSRIDHCEHRRLSQGHLIEGRYLLQ